MEYLLGVGVSLLVRGLKKLFNTDGLGTGFILLVVSIILAFWWNLVNDLGFGVALVQILTVAGAFHEFIIRKLPKEPREPKLNIWSGKYE